MVLFVFFYLLEDKDPAHVKFILVAGDTMHYLVKISLSALGLVSCATSFTSYADDSLSKIHNIQAKRLISPSAVQAKYEQKGKVYLYVGLKDKQVDRALDQQFDRIENFMFASIIKTDQFERALRNKKGELLLESDDC